MTEAPGALTTLLRGVARRAAGRRRVRRLTSAGAVGLGALALVGVWQGLHAPLGWPPVSVGLAAGLAGGLTVLTALGLELGARRPDLREAARLADRRLDLHDLLGTALTLPEHGAGPLEAALHTRIRARAQEAAGQHTPAEVVPPPSPAWSHPPAGLALLALVVWLAEPLPAPVRVEEAAPARAQSLSTTEEDPAGGGEKIAVTTPTPPPPSVSENSPTEPEAQATAPPATPQARTAEGGTSTRTSAASSSTGRSPRQSRPRESTQSLLQEARAANTATRPGGSARDTPFGSREGAFVSDRELQSNPDALAAAPYDPGGPGSQTQRQQNAGPPEERRASGGRGVENDGDDRCAADCLTNDDMNRGAQARTSKPPDPRGGNGSGTSDSGGGAAGSTSGVGLGYGRLPEVTVRFRRQLLAGTDAGGERMRVLAAPGVTPPTPLPGAATAGPWTPQPEPPLTPDAIPDTARSAVGAYFRRTP